MRRFSWTLLILVVATLAMAYVAAIMWVFTIWAPDGVVPFDEHSGNPTQYAAAAVLFSLAAIGLLTRIVARLRASARPRKPDGHDR